jgi:phosphatidylserine/phosphatidylglycerophosphate/cardiolipin synthase-like enzyme
MHIRAILRDGKRAFLGSQSLRKLELDSRREIGVFTDDPGVVRGLHAVFAQDWALTTSGKAEAREAERQAEPSKDASQKESDAAGAAHAE